MVNTPEISTFLRELGWRATVMLAVIAAGAAAPGATVLLQPPEFGAVATVRVPVLPSETGPDFVGADAGSELAAELDGVLSLPATRAAVAADAGISSRALENRLTVARAGTAQYVDVTFVGRPKSKARPVAHLAASRALNTLLHERLRVAKVNLEALEQRLGRVQALGPETKVLVAYQRARSEQARLEQLVARLLADGDQAGAQLAMPSLDAARAATIRAGDELVRFQQEAAKEGGAEQSVDQARDAVARLEEQIKAAAAANTVTDGPVRRVRPIKPAAEASIVGALVAGVLSFGIITLVEVRTVLRRRREEARTA